MHCTFSEREGLCLPSLIRASSYPVGSATFKLQQQKWGAERLTNIPEVFNSLVKEQEFRVGHFDFYPMCSLERRELLICSPSGLEEGSL